MRNYQKRAMSVAFFALLALACGESNQPTAPEVTPQPRVPEPPPLPPPPPPPTSDRIEQIVYSGSIGGGGLTLINSDGSGATPIAALGWAPAWSPDGKKLLFSNTQCDTDWYTYLRCDQGGLVMMDFETRTLTTPAGGAFGEDPAWAPDGERIAFVRHDESRGRRLFVMRLDGSEPREIPTPGLYDSFGPSWSPDGKRIVFQCHGPAIGICMANSDGTGFTHVSSSLFSVAEVSPRWSPDGRRIVFTALSGGVGKIALMSPAGSGAITLTEGYSPAWSSDGTRLSFSRDNDGLFTIGADGSNLRRVTSGITGSAAWRPGDPCNGCWDY